MRKRILPLLCVMTVLVLGCIGFTGCGAEKEVDEKLEDLEYEEFGRMHGYVIYKDATVDLYYFMK